jgi:tetratricopeptide (TPR) repeat protein
LKCIHKILTYTAGKLKIKIVILTILFPTITFSQSVRLDSLLLNGDTLDINKKIDHYLRLSSELINKNLDSAMLFAEKANSLIGKLETDTAKSDVYKNLGDVYAAWGNFALSLDYYYKAKGLTDDAGNLEPENIQIIYRQYDLLTKIGIVYFYQKNLDQALKYFEEALKVTESITTLSPDINTNDQKIRLFNNIASVYLQKLSYDKALEYYKSAMEENEKKGNKNLEASLLNNIGICYLEKRDFNMANHYFNNALVIRKEAGDRRGEAQCFNNMGKNSVYTGNFNQARDYFEKALNLGRDIGNKESIMISLQSLASIYDTLGDYRNAYLTYKEFKSINDSLFNAESIKRIAQLELQYKFDKQQKLFDLELKRREAEKQKRELLYLIIGGTLFFLLLTAILLIYLQRSKIRNAKLEKEKLELEHKHINLEKQKLREELEFKNRELTTNVVYLLKKNELITNISEKLIKSKLDFKVENQKIIQDIINELKSSQDTDIWTEFEAHFTQVHTEFYRRLNEKYPNLSSNEKKLCAFLRLNMSTKDISAITYQSINSITVARSRLRKKLNIEGEDVNLVNFLMQF